MQPTNAPICDMVRAGVLQMASSIIHKFLNPYEEIKRFLSFKGDPQLFKLSFMFAVEYLSHSDNITDLHSANLDFVRQMKSL